MLPAKPPEEGSWAPYPGRSGPAQSGGQPAETQPAAGRPRRARQGPAASAGDVGQLAQSRTATAATCSPQTARRLMMVPTRRAFRYPCSAGAVRRASVTISG